MIAVLLILAVGVGLWWRRRVYKRSLVAGLTAERPAFHVEPPPGRIGSRKRECL